GRRGCLSSSRCSTMSHAWPCTARTQPRPVRRNGFAKPGAPRPLLAAEGALIQHDPPFPGLFLPNQDTPIVISERCALKGPGTLPAMPHKGRLLAKGPDNDLAARPMIQPIARRADDRQDRLTIEGQPVGTNVEVVLGHQTFHCGRVLLSPRQIPALAE